MKCVLCGNETTDSAVCQLCVGTTKAGYSIRDIESALAAERASHERTKAEAVRQVDLTIAKLESVRRVLTIERDAHNATWTRMAKHIDERDNARQMADYVWTGTETAELDALRLLVGSLPKCDMCFMPATKAYRRGESRWCDGHAPELCPDYPRAKAIRAWDIARRGDSSRFQAELEAARRVVEALPKCGWWNPPDFDEPSESCNKTATRSGRCEGSGLCCDEHKCRHACPELQYAQAVRDYDKAVKK